MKGKRCGVKGKASDEKRKDLLIAKYYEPMPYPSMRGVETVLGYIEKDTPKAKTADPKSFVDDSLLREIEAAVS